MILRTFKFASEADQMIGAWHRDVVPINMLKFLLLLLEEQSTWKCESHFLTRPRENFASL